MSGPDIHRPRFGDNAIGQFIIGVSPIGSIAPFDYWQTIISQYANSEILTALIGDFFESVDPTVNIDGFFDTIWNVTTAQGYGLDVWGRIVGVGRSVRVPNASVYFDFKESGASGHSFGEQSFFNGDPLTSVYDLTDTAYRTLIYAKALSNITDGTIPSINQILLALFPFRGNAYVTDDHPVITDWFGFEEASDTFGFGQDSFYSGFNVLPMAMTYTFEFVLSPVELAIVKQSGVLPTPTGVSVTIVSA